MKVRVLGCSGAIALNCRTTSFLLDDDVLVDAGTGVGDLTLEQMGAIGHVLLTHVRGRAPQLPAARPHPCLARSTK